MPGGEQRELPISISYFFPAYNEEGNLGPMVAHALRVLPRFTKRFEILVVDDGSSDGTEAEGRELEAQHREVRYLRHPANRGYGEAIRTGLHESRNDAVLFTDGDQQFDLAELERLWPHLEEADIVVGYRIKRADPAHRLFIAWTYKNVLRALFGLRVRDVDCAFKLMRGEVARSVNPDSGGAFFSAEFILRARHAGYRMVEVGVNHYPRKLGKPKGATPAVILRTFREMFALRRRLESAPAPARGR